MARPCKRPWTIIALSAPYELSVPYGKWTDISEQMEEQIKNKPNEKYGNCDNNFEESFTSGFNILQATIMKTPKKTSRGITLTNIIFMNLDTGVVVYANPKSIYIDETGPIVAYTIVRAEPDKRGHITQKPIQSLDLVNHRLFKNQIRSIKTLCL